MVVLEDAGAEPTPGTLELLAASAAGRARAEEAIAMERAEAASVA